ncbi:MAG: TonB family protein [Nibricoccus sp.]
MEKPKRWFGIVLVAAVLEVSPVVFAAGESKPKQPDIPGSAVMPLKPLDMPTPPAFALRSTRAKLHVWTKPDGTVDSVDFVSGSREWAEAVIDTVKKWRFEPVVWEGEQIPARVDVDITQHTPKDIRINLSPLPNLPGELHTEAEWSLTKPILETDLETVLPLAMRVNPKIGSEVVVGYIIAEDGSTDKIELLGATSENGVRAALDLISERKYNPATIRGQPVRMQYKQILVFQGLNKAEESLSGADDLVDPVYPYERLLANEEGYAKVKFTINSAGMVESAEIVEASHPDFGAALIAAAESWHFRPGTAGEQPVREYRHEFQLSNLSYATRRFVRQIGEGTTVSNQSVGLDARPKPLARPALAYPTGLLSQRVAGEARVEFIIDRVGLAQLPRVVSATRPEFGWAAATLVNGMRFTPPTRGGKPTELRVVIPVPFTPPKAAEPEQPKSGG